MKKMFSKPLAKIDFLRFIVPSALCILTISLYSVVDAIFISRFAGTLAMASMNIVAPLFSLSLGLGIMVMSGASAIIGIEMGEEKLKQANGHFSFTFCVIFSVFLVIMLAGYSIGSEKISLMLGATDLLLPYCVEYLDIMILGIAALCLQVFFEYFMRLDGKPSWALYSSLLGGGVNVVLDYVLIVRLGMGLRGAAIASVLGILAASLNGVIYFIFKSINLKVVRPLIQLKFLINAMTNGSSEMITEIAVGVKTIVFNYAIIKYVGETGVAAMSILMYLFMLLSSLFIGISAGVSPLISFNYGRNDFKIIRKLLSMSLQFITLLSVMAFGIGMFYGSELIDFFARGQTQVVSTAERGITIVAFSFLICGFNILASVFFTSVNNGKISALIAFLKTFVFTFGFVAILPPLMGLDGIWFSVPAAEIITLMVSLCFLVKYRGDYLVSEKGIDKKNFITI